MAERIFGPLFTTKSNGIGMGPSICRSIIEGHNRRLWFDPNKPEGANFQFKVLADSTTSADAPRGDRIQQI
jgi:signal transduction histidine kinase